MTRVSRAKLKEDRLKEIVDQFTHLLTSLNNNHEIEKFLDDFLTKEEKIMLAKRLMLFMMVKRNYPPTVIQSALHVSYESVRTYTNQFAGKNDVFQRIINKLIEKEKMQEFWKKIDKILKPIDLIMRSRNDMKARAKLASGDWG